MELKYVPLSIEEKKNKAFYFKKIGIALTKAGVMGGIYYGLYRLKNSLESIEESCLEYGDEIKHGNKTALALSIVSLIGTLSLLSSIIYIVGSTHLKQRRIIADHIDFEVDLETILKSMVNRIHMINSLDQMYSGKISKENLIEVYKDLSKDARDITIEEVDNIIINNPRDSLGDKIETLAYEFVKLEHKYLELLFRKKHQGTIHNVWKLNGRVIGLILSAGGILFSNIHITWIITASLVIEQSKFIESIVRIIQDDSLKMNIETDQVFNNEARQVLGDLRTKYENILKFTGIEFDEIFFDEYCGDMNSEVYNLDGSKRKHEAHNDKDHKHYVKPYTMAERISDLASTCGGFISSCGSGTREVLSCTGRSGYEALRWSSTQISDVASVVRNNVTNLFVSPIVNGVAIEETEMNTIERV